jgi:hypothetical protein
VGRKSIAAIAADLNATTLRTTRGKAWTSNAIDIMLTNEIYIGNLVFNRKSYRLQRAYIDNPTEMWIRHDKAVKPIIALKIFKKAQTLKAHRRKALTDQEALDRLDALWRRKGNLSTRIIEAAKGVPSPTTYITRFGSLANAYAQVGFRLRPRLRFAQSKNKVKTVMTTTVEAFTEAGAASFDDQTRILTTTRGLIISLRVAWHHRQGRLQTKRWYLKGSAYAKPAIDVRSALMLVIKMTANNRDIDNYYLIPTARLSLSKDRHLRFTHRVFSEEFRYASIEVLCRSLAEAT